MADFSNNAVLAAIGQPTKSQDGDGGGEPLSIPANTVSLRNIVTNGALLNQNISQLIQKVNALKTAWGG
mgnify:CR=1 FL=1